MKYGSTFLLRLPHLRSSPERSLRSACNRLTSAAQPTRQRGGNNVGAGKLHCTGCTPPALPRLTTTPRSPRACSSAVGSTWAFEAAAKIRKLRHAKTLAATSPHQLGGHCSALALPPALALALAVALTPARALPPAVVLPPAPPGLMAPPGLIWADGVVGSMRIAAKAPMIESLTSI